MSSVVLRGLLVLMLLALPAAAQEVKVDHDAHQPVQPGDVVAVVVQAAPGLRVAFSLGTIVNFKPMTEIKPGVYAAEYTIRRGENLNGQLVSAVVVQADGQRVTTTATYPIGSPPPKPSVGEGLEISQVTCQAPEWAGPGSVVQFKVDADAGATGDVKPLGTGLSVPLAADRNGGYAASWTVPRTNKLLVEGRFPVCAVLSQGAKHAMLWAKEPLALDTRPPEFAAMSPGNGDERRDGASQVTVCVAENGSGIDPQSLVFTVDGRSVVPAAVYADGFVTWKPTEALPAGRHELALQLADRTGNRTTLTWSFTVTAADIKSVTHNFTKTKPLPGDVVTVSAEGEPGGQASFSIGRDISGIRMTESPAGKYTGSYTVRRGQNLGGQTVGVVLTLPTGQKLTATAKEPISEATAAAPPAAPTQPANQPLTAPTVTSPADGAAVAEHQVFQGKAKANTKVRLSFASKASVVGILEVTGTLPTVTVTVNAKGEWQTEAIAMNRPGPVGKTTFTVTVVALEGDKESPATVLKVTR